MFNDSDLKLFEEGRLADAVSRLGAHPATGADGASGVHFAVWEPAAGQVFVSGGFNGWEKPGIALTAAGAGLWEAFVPGAGPGTPYKYEVTSNRGRLRVDKPDPLTFEAEAEPGTASLVAGYDHEWNDSKWMEGREGRNGLGGPIAIYQVHGPSWRRVPEDGNRPLGYRELAPRLADHAASLGFTHVELLSVMEAAWFGSAASRQSGPFAPDRRYGAPPDFMYLVDYLHQRGIGVVLEWRPPQVSVGDGPRDGWNLFVGAALLWLERYHVDALRITNLETWLYKQSAAPGFSPRSHAGGENVEAIPLLRRLNEEAYGRHPGIQMMAEEYCAWPMVSRPTYLGGLGFGLKWDDGWARDTLEYMSLDPIFRKYRHDRLCYRMSYAFTENFVLALPHTVTAGGQPSLLARMPGDEWQKFANLRLLFGYMYGLPGKKLAFMGGEFGQWRGWDETPSLDWHLAGEGYHAGVQNWLGALNRAYRANPALHQLDSEAGGFEWVDYQDVEQSILCFLRKGRGPARPVLVVCNFTPMPRTNYRVGVPGGGAWREVLNSDAREHGGAGWGNFGGLEAAPIPAHGRPFSLNLTLPPLGAIFLESEEELR